MNFFNSFIGNLKRDLKKEVIRGG